jgi:hypothetical protein
VLKSSQLRHIVSRAAPGVLIALGPSSARAAPVKSSAAAIAMRRDGFANMPCHIRRQDDDCNPARCALRFFGPSATTQAMGFARDERALLGGFRVAQIGGGLAAAVAGRLFADVGAAVTCLGADRSTPLLDYLNHGKRDGGDASLAAADLIVAEGSPAALSCQGYDPQALRRVNATAAIVTIAPFGQTGPRAGDPASDLTLMYGSGIARLLTGQVDNLAEAPIRPVGEQSAFIAGLAAACAGMHAPPGSVIDISAEETLATLAMTELANAGLGGKARSRKPVSVSPTATARRSASCRRATATPRSHRARTGNGQPGSRSWARRPGVTSRASKPSRIASPTGTRCTR